MLILPPEKWQSGRLRQSCHIVAPSGKTVTRIPSMFYAYILKSLKDNKYYYGYCEYLDIRLTIHNAGKVRSTKSRRPFEIHYSESFVTKTEAIKRENFFKSIDGYNWLKQNKIILLVISSSLLSLPPEKWQSGRLRQS